MSTYFEREREREMIMKNTYLNTKNIKCKKTNSICKMQL